MSGQHAMQDANPEDYDDSTPDDPPGMTLSEMLGALRRKVWLLTLGPLGAGLIALGVSLLIAPTFTATTSLMPPQQSQSGAASALASLGSLSNYIFGKRTLSITWITPLD